MPYAAVALAIALWLTALGIVHLASRYAYTTRSLGAVAACFAVGFGLARSIVQAVWPSWPPFWGWLATLGLGLEIGLILALAVVFAWSHRARAGGQDVLEALRREESRVRERLARIAEALHDQRVRREVEGASQEQGQAMAAQHRRVIESWLQAGGAARIRSLRVEEWRQEIIGLTPDRLLARRRELAREAADASDPEQRAVAAVQAVLVEIALLEHRQRTSEPNPTSTDELAFERSALDRRLAELRHEIEWRRRRLQEAQAARILLK